jgi:hypothetical protein
VIEDIVPTLLDSLFQKHSLIVTTEFPKNEAQ